MSKRTSGIRAFDNDSVGWYTDIVTKSDLFAYGMVKGSMILKPYGFKIWKFIQQYFTEKFEELGVEEVLFPTLIPESAFTKEKEHVEGFAPELFKITKMGSNDLKDAYILRPTSEILFNNYFKENITTYKQLPTLLNQWVNVFRWENNTRPFLRTSEFYWQEGHTIHLEEKEAKDFAEKIHKIYFDFIHDVLRIDCYTGVKTESEKFAGAEKSYTNEIVLRDGKCLQSSTSHYLSTNFTKAFDAKIQNKDNKYVYPYSTSWGVSTRLIGGIVLTHSDDFGLRLPSRISPYQIVILTVYNKSTDASINNIAQEIKNKLKSYNFRVKLDDSEKGLGFKSQDWEIKGVPLRIVIGEKEVVENKISLISRFNQERSSISFNELTKEYIKKNLEIYDDKLLENSVKAKQENQKFVNSIEEIEKYKDSHKQLIAYWTPNMELEKELKDNYSLSIRALIQTKGDGICIHSKKQTNTIAIFSESY